MVNKNDDIVALDELTAEMAREFHKLDPKDLNDEACLDLAEEVLTDLNGVIESTVRSYLADPKNTDILRHIGKLKRLMASDYFNALTFGHGDDVLKDFEGMLSGDIPLNESKKKAKELVDARAKDNYYRSKKRNEVREAMKNYRQWKRFSLEDMADICGISETLLQIIEDGGVTHPKIAERIKKAYKLTDIQAEQLVPEIHRPSSPNYNPDKYKEDVSNIATLRIMPKKELVDLYLGQVNNKFARMHQARRGY